MSEPFPKQGGRFQSCIAHDSHILSFIFTETGVPEYRQHSAHFFILHSCAVVFSFYCPPPRTELFRSQERMFCARSTGKSSSSSVYPTVPRLSGQTTLDESIRKSELSGTLSPQECGHLFHKVIMTALHHLSNSYYYFIYFREK
jgi:hypothetical protein